MGDCGSEERGVGEGTGARECDLWMSEGVGQGWEGRGWGNGERRGSGGRLC